MFVKIIYNPLHHLIFIFQLNVKGYNDKLTILLTKIVERMSQFVVDPERLEIFKEIVSKHS